MLKVSLLLSLFFTFGYCEDAILAFNSAHPKANLLPNNCGRGGLTDRIVHGENANLGQFPWMAILLIDGILQCGGALISEKYVLTAAHCVASGKVQKIRLGEYDLRNETDCQNDVCAPKYQDIEIEDYSVFDGYNLSSSTINDIALIRLSKKAEFNDFVQPICLPHKSVKGKDKIYQTAGWGIYDLNIPESAKVLQTVSLPYINLRKCKKSFKKVKVQDEGHLCAGGRNHQDSCGGDSGGPLMDITDINGIPTYYIIGIVSFGVQKCGVRNLPGIYTDVDFYYDWILNHMKP